MKIGKVTGPDNISIEEFNTLRKSDIDLTEDLLNDIYNRARP